MSLKIIDEGYEGWGIYVGGYNIAPDVLLIRARSFDEAWEIMVDEFGEQGSIRRCAADDCPNYDQGDLPCEGCEFGSSGGPYVTLDLTLRVERPGRSD